jgi:predicted small secreted protein
MRRTLALLLSALALTSASFAGCGNTSGRAITLTFHAVGEGASHFTTASGWTVDLSEARIVLGPIYALAPTPGRTTQLERLLVPVAYAHGGHDDYASLGVRAEWLDQLVVDLLAPSPTLLGTADGTAGPAEYATVHLEPPPTGMVISPHASAPHELWIAGTATMGTTTIPFEGGLDIPQDALGNLIEGIAITQDGVSAPAFPQFDTSGDLLITVHVGGQGGASPAWLDQADFSRLPMPATGAIREITSTTQPYTAWLLSARDSSTFTARYSPPTTTGH